MKAIYKALADFQQEVPVIHKGSSSYGYKYADWAEILDVINPLLKKHGLGFTQLLDGTALRTMLFHVESGETINSEVTLPQDVELKGMNKFQVAGSAITYYRRYSLSAMLGLVTDEDNDANGKNTKSAPKTQPVASNKPTEAQLAKITELAKELGIKEADIPARVAKVTTKALAEATIKKMESDVHQIKASGGND